MKVQTFMKLFSNLWASIAMLSMLSLATSCENSSAFPEQPTTPTEPEYVTVSLGVDFVDLDVTYEPLSRAQKSKDVYGIQVYSAVPTSGEYDWQPFAFGVFDSTDNLTINLLKGYEYKFVATMIKDAKEKLIWHEYWGDDEYVDNHEYFYSTISDNFTYGISDGGYSLQHGYTFLPIEDGCSGNYHHPNVERYYGELEGYTPTDNGGKAKIQLKRTSFGAKYIAKGKNATNGTLEIIMDGAPQLNLNLAESNQISEIYTFLYVREAWLENNYSETITVLLRLVREDGTTVPLGTHNLTFKRNATTVVNINTDDCSESSGVGVEFIDSGDMPDGDEITIKDGEIVDTEIEAN